MPRLEKLKELEVELDFKIFLINLKGQLKKTRSVLEDNDVTIPVLLDCGYYSRDILQVNYTPTTFVVDSEGVIRSRIVGGVEDLPDIIVEVLKRI